jgi:hypothetical protein
VRFRRRREALHERLLREAGLEQAPLEWEPKHAGLPLAGDAAALDSAGITGLHRAREWDATAAVDAPDLGGEEVAFVVLPDGSVLVDDETGDAPLAPLADALEEQLRPPYRARGVRRRGDVWAVAAKAIEVIDLRPDVEGDELELVSRAGERTLTVDGARAFGSVPQLEQLGAGRAADYVVHASRLDGSLWEVRIAPL